MENKIKEITIGNEESQTIEEKLEVIRLKVNEIIKKVNKE
jgi:hypothetical protein